MSDFRALCIVAVLFLGACGDQSDVEPTPGNQDQLGEIEGEKSLPHDPYLARIDKMPDDGGLDMPPGFKGKFREQYLEQVTPEIEGMPYDPDDPVSIGRIQSMRELIYYNLWGVYGVDFFMGGRLDETKGLMAEQATMIQEGEIEIARLRGRIDELEEELALAKKAMAQAPGEATSKTADQEKN